MRDLYRPRDVLAHYLCVLVERQTSRDLLSKHILFCSLPLRISQHIHLAEAPVYNFCRPSLSQRTLLV